MFQIAESKTNLCKTLLRREYNVCSPAGIVMFPRKTDPFEVLVR